jgi:hypothetical protein
MHDWSMSDGIVRTGGGTQQNTVNRCRLRYDATDERSGLNRARVHVSVSDKE